MVLICRHINNIYKECELDKKRTCAKNAHIVSNRDRLKEQMVILFDRDRSVISRYIKNIYDESELDKGTSVHFLHISNNNPTSKNNRIDIFINPIFINSKKIRFIKLYYKGIIKRIHDIIIKREQL